MNVERNPDEARQASKQGVARYVLAISLSAAAIALIVIFLAFAQ